MEERKVRENEGRRDFIKISYVKYECGSEGIYLLRVKESTNIVGRKRKDNNEERGYIEIAVIRESYLNDEEMSFSVVNSVIE